MMTTVELDLGPVQVRDTGGDGPPVVFVHGLLVNDRLWDDVAGRLAETGVRCIQPILPLGSHTIPVRDRAALTPVGVAAAVGQLLERLDLRAATLVANDTGGAITQLLLAHHPDRVGAVVLTNCDAFENFLPPAFRPLTWLAQARLRGAVIRLGMRSPAVVRSPLGFGLLSRRRIPDDLLHAWGGPAIRSAEIRRDLNRFAASIHRRDLLAVTDDLARFSPPVVLAWGKNDRFFKPSFAERLANLFPNGRLELIDDCATFVALDQPERLAAIIGEVVATHVLSPI